ncbi:MAG: sulfite exporter TauE/SafE family protein [Propionibacteriaceae bacterium]|nr:sulfite exporter TauE/SafE family protein [Propionibacteriaceae bacterium]
MDLSFVDEASRRRDAGVRRRKRLGFLVPGTITVVWLVCLTAFGLWPRVLDNWVATLTMVFGSFVAGSTPQGGGAVAFPVFTKALGISSEVARAFSLCIQTVGMGAATLVLIIRRVPVDRFALKLGIPAALVGFFLGLHTLSDTTRPFWPSILPGAYLKVGFTLLVMTTATIVWLGSRVPVREVRSRIRPAGPRQGALIIAATFIGGVASSQLGSGADVFFFLVAAVLLGLEPRVGVPTSVIIMATISTAGLLYLGVIHGMLDVGVQGERVVALGGQVLAAPLDAGRNDLLGLWLAGIIAACWAAPLGAAFAAAVSTRTLVAFVAVLALLEVITTVLFLPQLHHDPALITFALASTLVLLGALWLGDRYRHLIAGTVVDGRASLGRDAVDAVDKYAERTRRKRP